MATIEEKNRLAEENYNLIYYMAKKFIGSKVPFDELVSLGNIGLAKAINGFNKDKGIKFSTYASACINNEILHFLRKEKKHMENDVSLFNIVGKTKNNTSDLNLGDVLEEKNIENNKKRLSLEEELFLKEDIKILNKAIKKLAPREQIIIIYRYGLMGQKKKTQRDIAIMLNLSQANISKQEKIILEKLLKHLEGKIKVEESDYYKDVEIKDKNNSFFSNQN